MPSCMKNFLILAIFLFNMWHYFQFHFSGNPCDITDQNPRFAASNRNTQSYGRLIVNQSQWHCADAESLTISSIRFICSLLKTYNISNAASSNLLTIFLQLIMPTIAFVLGVIHNLRKFDREKSLVLSDERIKISARPSPRTTRKYKRTSANFEPWVGHCDKTSLHIFFIFTILNTM